MERKTRYETADDCGAEDLRTCAAIPFAEFAAGRPPAGSAAGIRHEPVWSPRADFKRLFGGNVRSAAEEPASSPAWRPVRGWWKPQLCRPADQARESIEGVRQAG